MGFCLYQMPVTIKAPAAMRMSQSYSLGKVACKQLNVPTDTERETDTHQLQ